MAKSQEMSGYKKEEKAQEHFSAHNFERSRAG
jgi:hypothetical protein